MSEELKLIETLEKANKAIDILQSENARLKEELEKLKPLSEDEISQECKRRLWLLQGDEIEDSWLAKGWVLGAKFMNEKLTEISSKIHAK